MRNVPAIRTVRNFHDHPAYVKSVAAAVNEYWTRHGRPDRLVMSFHGLPRFSLDQGDPYHCECLKTARLVATELGWHDEIKLAAAGDRLSINIRDKDGKAVNGLTIKATLGRPASEREDITVTLIETPEGIYEAAIPPRAAGTYIASIEAVDPGRAEEGILYRARERLWLKP